MQVINHATCVICISKDNSRLNLVASRIERVMREGTRKEKHNWSGVL